MPTVLIVDDDILFRQMLRETFESAGFTVHEAANACEAIQAATALRPSAVVLDLGLPDKSGFEVAETLKQSPLTCGIPILVLTGCHRDGQVIESREHGAEGYLVKGGPLEEVVGYVEVLIKPLHESEEKLVFGPVIIDLKERIVYVFDKPTPKLTTKEFDLLYFVACKSPQIISWEKIAQSVWDRPARYGKTSKTIEVHVQRIRRKLGPKASDILVTHKGVGIQFKVAHPSRTS